MNTIKCSNCGEEIEVDKALEGQIEARVLAAEHKKHEAELVKARTEAAESAQKAAETDLEIAKKKLEAEMLSAQKKSRAEQDLLIQSIKADAEEAKEDNKKLRNDLSEMMKTLREEKPDPDSDSDRIHFCLVDKEFRDRLFKMRHDFREMAELGKKFKEKEDNKHIYDAVKEVKQPKIAELVPLLSPILEKAGYIEFHLDKPEMGRDVYVGFSCLDNKSDRKDHDSRKTLKKLVDSALSDTSWRLMSDSISYRLGYLNGRVKAYEGKEALKELVIKSGKFKPKQTSRPATDKKAARTLTTPDGKKIIL